MHCIILISAGVVYCVEIIIDITIGSHVSNPAILRTVVNSFPTHEVSATDLKLLGDAGSELAAALAISLTDASFRYARPIVMLGISRKYYTEFCQKETKTSYCAISSQQPLSQLTRFRQC